MASNDEKERTVKLLILMTTVLLGSSVLMAGCDKAQAGYNESSADYSYDRRDAFREDMSRSLEKLDARLEQLREKAARGGENVKAGTTELIEETKAGAARLRQEISGAGDVSREKWNDFKRGFGTTMDDLGRKLEAAFR